jgi:hypothetical protein
MTTQTAKKEAQQATGERNKVFIFAAQDGREGKSTACKMLIHHLKEQRGKDPIVVDADPFNPNVANSYTPELVKLWGAGSEIPDKSAKRFLQPGNDSKAALTANEDKINDILSEQILLDGRHHLGRKILALTQYGRDVVVNISGNTYLQLCDFLETQQAHKSNLFDLCICWVSSGGDESLNLLIKTQKRFEAAQFMLILNEGNSQYVDDWMRYRLPKEIATLCHEQKLKLASLPLLSIESKFWLDRQHQPYSRWLNDESIDVFTRGAIKVWIDSACESIAESGCL